MRRAKCPCCSSPAKEYTFVYAECSSCSHSFCPLCLGKAHKDDLRCEKKINTNKRHFEAGSSSLQGLSQVLFPLFLLLANFVRLDNLHLMMMCSGQTWRLFFLLFLEVNLGFRSCQVPPYQVSGCVYQPFHKSVRQFNL